MSHEDGRLASRAVNVDRRLEDHGNHQPVCSGHREPTLRVMLHLKTMSNISKVAVAVGGVLFRLEWPRCNASMLLPLRSSPTLPPPFAFAILCNAGPIHSATGKSDAPYLFSQRKCHSPLQRGKALSLPAFPSSLPVFSSTTERQ